MTLAFVSVTEEVLILPEGEFVLRDGVFIEGTGELQTIRLSVPSLWTEVATVAVLLPENPDSDAEMIDGRDVRHYVLEEIRLIFVKDLGLTFSARLNPWKCCPSATRWSCGSTRRRCPAATEYRLRRPGR